MADIIGTDAADNLASTTDHQRVLGFGGDDAITVTHDAVTVEGATGNDTIDALLSRSATQTNLTSWLGGTYVGGDGNDHIGVVVADPDPAWANVDVTGSGGAGADHLAFDGQFVAGEAHYSAGSGDDVLEMSSATTTYSNLVADGDAGSDTLRVTSVARGGSIGGASATANGQSGNDYIEVSATAEGKSGDFGLSIASNAGSGDDTLIAATALAADASANPGTPWDWKAAPATRATLNGYDGNDIIVLTSEARSVVSSLETGFTIWGGRGDDRIVVEQASEAAQAPGSYEEYYLRHYPAIYAGGSVTGGTGNDRITVTTSAATQPSPAGTISLANHIEGNDGNDILDVIARIGAGASPWSGIQPDGALAWVASRPNDGRIPPPFSEVSNVLTGGTGNDSITGLAGTIAPSGTGPATAYNWIDGGVGNDTLTGRIEGVGRSTLVGGDGTDQLRVYGGTGNRLDGGKGDDLIRGGSGNDTLTGAAGADTFVLDLSTRFGNDRITDHAEADRLQFLGASDPDALARFDDQGPGDDLVVTFAGLGTLTFVGIGTGAINSFDDFATLI